jgi:hypothetical protein
MTRCRHLWRYEEAAPGCLTIRICRKCGLRQTWGYHDAAEEETT